MSLIKEWETAPAAVDEVIREEAITEVRTMMSDWYIKVAAYPHERRFLNKGQWMDVTPKDREIARRLCRRMQHKIYLRRRYEGLL